MYEMLAVTMELNKKPEEQVKAALGYAADLALAGKKPYDLTRVADTLHLHGMDDRAIALIDTAASLDPGNPRPIIMSINLAAEQMDAKRLGDAVERLLALGWPGTDAAWRAEARTKVEGLAAELEKKGKPAEAQSLLERLAKAEARDLVIRLTWSGDAGLDLYVDEPLGATASPLARRTVFGGALVADGQGHHPEEVYSCPLGFSGAYRVQVRTLYSDEKDPARDVRIEIITHDGTPQRKVVQHNLDLGNLQPIVVELENGRRTEVLPYQATTPPAELSEEPAKGSEKPAASGVTPTNAADALRAPKPITPPH